MDETRKQIIDLLEATLEAMRDDDLARAIVERNGCEVLALAASINEVCLTAELDAFTRLDQSLPLEA